MAQPSLPQARLTTHRGALLEKHEAFVTAQAEPSSISSQISRRTLTHTTAVMPFETSDRGVVHVVDDDVSLRAALESLFDSVGLASQTYGTARDFLNTTVVDSPGCVVIHLLLTHMNL